MMGQHLRYGGPGGMRVKEMLVKNGMVLGVLREVRSKVQIAELSMAYGASCSLCSKRYSAYLF